MSRKFIKDLSDGDIIAGQVFLVLSKEKRLKKNGAPYLHLVLGDKTGRISGKVWDQADILFEQFQVDDFVSIKGVVQTYNQKLDLRINSIREIEETRINPVDFMPQTNKGIPELLNRLKEILGSVKDKYLVQLIHLFLEDADWLRDFQNAPAATKHHHVYLGGLLEHTVTLAELALRILPIYPILNQDLLLTAIFLHDIGKIQELSYQRSFKYTNEGNLIGHITLGVMMLKERAQRIEGFPPDLLTSLTHLIISHHGTHEWGSPVLPGSPEAFALHYLDNLDAKLFPFIQQQD